MSPDKMNKGSIYIIFFLFRKESFSWVRTLVGRSSAKIVWKSKMSIFIFFYKARHERMWLCCSVSFISSKASFLVCDKKTGCSLWFPRTENIQAGSRQSGSQLLLSRLGHQAGNPSKQSEPLNWCLSYISSDPGSSRRRDPIMDRQAAAGSCMLPSNTTTISIWDQTSTAMADVKSANNTRHCPPVPPADHNAGTCQGMNKSQPSNSLNYLHLSNKQQTNPKNWTIKIFSRHKPVRLNNSNIFHDTFSTVKTELLGPRQEREREELVGCSAQHFPPA